MHSILHCRVCCWTKGGAPLVRFLSTVSLSDLDGQVAVHLVLGSDKLLLFKHELALQLGQSVTPLLSTVDQLVEVALRGSGGVSHYHTLARGLQLLLYRVGQDIVGQLPHKMPGHLSPAAYSQRWRLLWDIGGEWFRSGGCIAQEHRLHPW